MNICLSCDDKYSKYAGVVIASILLKSNVDEDFSFYILDSNISQENKDKILSLKSIKECSICFIKIDETLFKTYKNIGTHSYLSLPAFYRLKLPSILKDIDKVLYLDCDIIVNSSLQELYNTNIKNFYAAAVVDIATKSSGYVPKLDKGNLYFNAGVLLLNLEKMRTDNVEEKFEKYTIDNIATIRVGDQEILNKVCQGNIKQIDSCWNVQSSNFVNRSTYSNNPKIVHYIGKQKPWIFGSMNYWKNLYFEVFVQTPWSYSQQEQFKWTILNEIVSCFNYIKYRPLFLLRPRFYKALLFKFLKPNI